MSESRALRWASGACVVLGGMLAPPVARAEPMTDSTVLVLGGEHAPLTKRLRAELRALGLHVLVAEAEDVSLAQLEVRARAAGAALALSTRETREGVELRLVDRVTGKMLLREVLERDLSSRDPDALLALRALELLRASLLELELTHPPRGEVAPTNALREATRRSMVPSERARSSSASNRAHGFEESVLAGVGVSAFAHLGQTRPESGLSALLLWQPTAKAGVAIWGTIPFGAVDVTTAEGAAYVRSQVFVAGLRFSPLPPDEWLQPTLGAGAAMLWLSVAGTRARSDLVLTSEEIAAGGPYAEMGGGLRVTPGLTLRAEIRALVAFPRPVIAFADREVTTLGRPFVAASLGVEYRAFFSADRD